MDDNRRIRYTVDSLKSHTDESAINAIIAEKDIYERAYKITNLLHDVLAESIIRSWKGHNYSFTGHIYEPIENNVLKRLITVYMSEIGIMGKDVFMFQRKFISTTYDAIQSNKLEPKNDVLAFKNGVVNVITGEIFPFGPKFHLIHQLDYNWDPTAKCDAWEQFLLEVLPEIASRQIIQMYFGMGLLDRAVTRNKVELCLTLVGEGSNGKSVIYETMLGVFGRERISSMGLMSLIRGGDERMRNMAQIEGKCFNYCSEIEAKDVSLYTDSIKALASGEPQQARILGQMPELIYNIPYLVFNANALPRSTDDSVGYYRRFMYVVFDKIIPANMQNKSLAFELRREYPGIMQWLVRGINELVERNWVFPTSKNSVRKNVDYMAQNNVTLAYITARGIHSAGKLGERGIWVKGERLYRIMVKFAEANGYETATRRKFGTEMRRLGFNNDWCYRRRCDGIYYRVFGVTQSQLFSIPVIYDVIRDSEDISYEQFEDEDINIDDIDEQEGVV